MYYQTIVVYRNPSTGESNNFIDLVYAKNDAEALGIAIDKCRGSVSKNSVIVNHAVCPLPGHPYSKDYPATISNENSEGDFYITLLARKVPNSLFAVISLLDCLDDVRFGEMTIEEVKGLFLSSESHQSKPQTVINLLKVANHLVAEMDKGIDEYQSLLIKTLTENIATLSEAIADSVSATGGSNAQADS